MFQSPSTAISAVSFDGGSWKNQVLPLAVPLTAIKFRGSRKNFWFIRGRYLPKKKPVQVTFFNANRTVFPCLF